MGVRRTRVDDYLLAITELGNRSGKERVRTGAIAQELGISKGTCSSFVKKLAQQGWLDLQPYDGVTLTEAGRDRCRRYVSRIELLERFLSHTLSVARDRFAEDAWLLEPALSHRLESLITRHLTKS